MSQGLLLDTHVLLWLVDGDKRLGPEAREAIETRAFVAYSVASLWEIAIKQSIRRLELGSDGPTRHLQGALLRLHHMPLRTDHVDAVARLVWPTSGHRDPFDRMLVCQAETEGLTLVTADGALGDYDVSIMDARA